MYRIDDQLLEKAVTENVESALAEDIGAGDVTALLISEACAAMARIIVRENAIVCGIAWVDKVFRQIDPRVEVKWSVADGDRVEPGQSLCELSGDARSLLSGERSALNFLQVLSGTATRSHYYASLVKETPVKLLDTRKTLPGLRLAQKYAVTCGGCLSHRMGLYDGYLIKENHITACGGIAMAIAEARRLAPEKPIEVEVEDLKEFEQALLARPDMIMLDNFGVEDMRTAVRVAAGRVMLEASGGVTEATLVDIARTGVDYISLGTLTKDLKAIDLSMRLSM
ncbi:carboxylating nicotinate-nucleotide diphosphorylase [Halomonas sp. M4R5S39]|uniref:carboxylating nicotinate-nucleotide diphosphorylase n=1 Tax=Halomonas kalidii TaxID=3043293 RepID=UPI0024A97540|nr:carboxylating nicotinate-nucleotide diphosphorylase [Halomonas kalidii]MDI5984207.1 carboxylating nicotinate-nucleotide diphosphorylase [Halomonas kalidii]